MGNQALGQGLCASTVVLVASGRHVPFVPSLQALAQQSDIRLLTEPVQDAISLLPALERYLPQVLLLDEPIFDALDTGKRDRLGQSLDVRVLLICAQPEPPLLEEILRCRFHGMLQMTTQAQDCLKAVRAVSRGELWCPRRMLSVAIAGLMQAGGASASRHTETLRILTGREMQIAEFVREGLTNKEIGHRLGIMEDTVKKHLQSVFGKLGVKRRALVTMAMSGAIADGRRASRLSASR